MMPKEKKTAPSKSAERKAVPKRDVAREIRRRQERPLVVVNFSPPPAGLTVQGAVMNMIPTDKDAATVVMELGCPVVRIGSMPHPMDHQVPAVMPDRYAAGRMAAEHFHERGFEHVGYVGRSPWGDAKALYDGLQARASELGIECHLVQLTPEPGVDYGERYAGFSASLILAVDNPMVARAMRFMWEHLDLDLSVDDVAREVGVVGRTLRRAFSRSLGRSFIAELQRRRLAELCRLLRSTDAPIADLAPRVGFRTMAHLHRCFRRAYDMSPRQYRVQEKRPSA